MRARFQGPDFLGTTPEQADEVPKASVRPRRRGTLAAAGSITLAVMASRVLGVLRESLRATLLGAGFHADAFVIAFRIPNLLRDLFAEGALSAAFVPTFTEFRQNRSREEAHRMAGLVLALLLIVTGALTLLGMVFAEAIVGVIAPGFADIPGKTEFAATLTAIMMPFLMLISTAAVLMGMLNAQRYFFVPALAPALFNVVAIGAGAGLYVGTQDPRVAAIGWSAAVLAGGLLQVVAQLPLLFKLGFRFRLAVAGMFTNPGVRRILRLMAPAAVGLGAVQLSILVNSIFASELGNGPLSWLDYAFRVYYLPIGLFGVALGVVTQTNVSEDVARGDRESLRSGLGHSLRLVMFLTIPAMFGLVALAEPIVTLLFGYGRFEPEDAAATAMVLRAYALGLLAVSAVKVLVPLFYAADRPRVPMVASLVAVGINVGFNWWSYRAIGAEGIALGMALGSLANAFVLLVVAGREIGGWRGERLGGAFLRVLIASVATGALAWYSSGLLEQWWPWQAVPEFLGRVVVTLVPIALAVVIYFALSRVLRVEEVGDFGDLARKVASRMRRRSAR